MIFCEYTIKEKTILTKLIEYLEPLVNEDDLDKILDFYNYYDASYFTLENLAVFDDFIYSLKN